MPESLRLGFVRSEVETVDFRGWKGTTNGELLARAVQAGFEAIVTADRLLYPQNAVALSGLRLIVLPTNRLRVLQGRIAEIEDALFSTPPGRVKELA
ncbi:MAG: hypothetical protein NBV67_10025 [Tagaea sp.]|nr:hypothetical protein [Tagaea sp.]